MTQPKIFIWMIIAVLSPVCAQEYYADGTDFMMGSGAAQIAKAGSTVADDNGVHAMYWNPAGLIDITGSQIALTGQLDRPLAHIGFLGAAFALPTNQTFGLSSTIGFSYVPRAHFRAKGVFKNGELVTTFLRFGLPGFPGEFRGDVASHTDDYRIGYGLRFDKLPRLDLGFSIGKIFCTTDFTGYKDQDNKPSQVHIDATALSLDIGARYHINDGLTIGTVVKNIGSTLRYTTVEKHNSITQTRTSSAKFITDISVGLSYKYSDQWKFDLAYQNLYGHYGGNEFDFRFIKASATRHSNLFDYYLGIFAPIKIKNNRYNTIKLPAPAMPTAGIRYTWQKQLTVDAALYLHPVMSLATHSIKPALELSIDYRF